jgi:hypothetical protein
MRRVLVLFVIVICGGGTLPDDVHGQYVRLYSDSLGGFCDLLDSPPGLRTVYIILHGGQSSGLRFRLQGSLGMNMTYLSETHYASVLEGDTQSGITFCMDWPQGDPVLLATLRYQAHGTCPIRVQTP